MSWIKLDDQFFAHPKVVNLSKDAKLLYLAGLTYCGAQLTDGLLTAGAVRILLATIEANSEAIASLIDAELWEVASPGDYRVHDYLAHQASRDEVVSLKAERAAAGRRGGQRSGDTRRAKAEANEANGQAKPKQNRSNIQITDTENNKNTHVHADAREGIADAIPLTPPAELAPPDPAWDSIPPAANHALSSKPIVPAPKPSKDTAALTAYEPVYAAYPRRYGAGPNWDMGLAEFVMIAASDRPAVLTGVRHFAQHPDAMKADGEFVPSLERFLRERRWTQYQTPPVSGKAARAAPPPVELSPYQQRQAEKRRAAASGVASA